MKKEIILIFLIVSCIVAVFFFPIFKGHIPFPGDLLVGTNPYRSFSFGGYAPGGIPNKAQGTDVMRELYPWKHFVIEMFKKSQIAFWNPYNFSGNPLMANFQSGAFYPLNLIFLSFPFNNAWTLFIFLIPLLSALFTYLFLREIKISVFPALFGGIVFAFSSYMVVWMEYGNIGHTFLWLPLGLFLTEKLIHSDSIGVHNFQRKYLFFLTGVLFASILAGYIQGYFYILLILSFYFIVKSFYNQQLLTTKTLLFFLSILSPFFLTLFQLLPTLELFQNSSRGNYSLDTIEKLLNPWWYAITGLAPDFFGNPATNNHWFDGTYIERVSYFGVIPFILALIALFELKKRKEALIFAITFIISLLLAYDFLFTKFLYLIPVPIISTTVPTRILSIFVFSGAILSAIGLDIILKGDKKKFVYLALVLTGLLLGIAWIAAILQKLTISERNLVFPSLVGLAFLILFSFYSTKKSFKHLFILALFAITLFDLFRFFHKITPFSPSEYIYPSTPVISYIQKNAGINRYWGYGGAHIETNIQLYDHTFLPDGHDALHNKIYAQLVSSSKDGKIPSELSRSDSEIDPGFGAPELLNNNYRQKILNILGVKYLLYKDEFFTENKTLKLLWQDSSWKIYENTQAAPRAFLTADYLVLPNKKDIIPAFYNKNFNEKEKIILEENPNLQKSKMRIKKVKLITYEPNLVRFNTSSDAEALLFLSDAYYPGWKASIDGKPTKIFIADYAFRAVKVPKGEHIVEFYYFPESFKNGLILSGVAFIGLLVLIFLRLKSLKHNYLRRCEF